jgi:predicted DNA-binding transcriptional regulator AlpA
VTERLLTARELGEVLGLSTATVLDRFERSDLPGFRLFGRKGGPVRFRLSEVLAVLEGWRFGTTPAHLTDARASASVPVQTASNRMPTRVEEE